MHILSWHHANGGLILCIVNVSADDWLESQEIGFLQYYYRYFRELMLLLFEKVSFIAQIRNTFSFIPLHPVMHHLSIATLTLPITSLESVAPYGFISTLTLPITLLRSIIHHGSVSTLMSQITLLRSVAHNGSISTLTLSITLLRSVAHHGPISIMTLPITLLESIAHRWFLKWKKGKFQMMRSLLYSLTTFVT